MTLQSGGDLFGHASAPGRVSDPDRVEGFSLTNFADRETAKAWFLSPSGNPGHGRFAPKSKCRRGVGPDINVFFMPRWLAAQNGWLK